MTEGERPAAPRTWPWWAGFFAVVGVALRLSLLAYEERLPEMLRELDKVVHFTMAGLLAFFLDGALRQRAFALGRLRLPVAGTALLLVVGIEEYLQRYSVHRTSSFGDYAADVAGVVVLTWLSRRVGRA